MKFIKACLLLLLLSVSPLVSAVTDLGSFSRSLNPSSLLFKRDSLNNNSMGGGILKHSSAINYEFGNLKLSSHINNFALNFFDSGNSSIARATTVTSISFSSPMMSNSSLNITGSSSVTTSNNHGMEKMVSTVPKQWVMVMVGLFLVGMQVMKAKRAVEPLTLKESQFRYNPGR